MIAGAKWPKRERRRGWPRKVACLGVDCAATFVSPGPRKPTVPGLQIGRRRHEREPAPRGPHHEQEARRRRVNAGSDRPATVGSGGRP
jgi:hypothetical protein